MTWTYGGDPSANDRDEVRFLIQDTNTNDQLLSDEEIAYLLAEYTASNLLAAARACEVIATKFARDASLITIGDTTVDHRKRAQIYLAMSRDLMFQYQASVRTGGIYIGGVIEADVDAIDDDTSLIQPKFIPGEMDND